MVKLIPVNYSQDQTTPSFKIWLHCANCGKHKRPFQMMADAEGIPYQSYYCKNCSEPSFNTPEDLEKWLADLHEHAIVRVKELIMHPKNRNNMGMENIIQDPKIGDIGIIVSISSYNPRIFTVESCNKDGKPIWLAEFIRDELEVVK